MTSYNSFGLSKEDIEKIIDKELEINADLLIGIDDPEMQEMIDVIKKAVSKAVSKNNSQIEECVKRLIRKHDEDMVRGLRRGF